MPKLLRNALSAQQVRHAGPGSYVDGNGLMLRVRDGGSRTWVQRLMVHGRRVDIGLGSAELVRLADARRIAADNRAVARTGGDPRRARAVTFRGKRAAVRPPRRRISGRAAPASKTGARWPAFDGPPTCCLTSAHARRRRHLGRCQARSPASAADAGASHAGSAMGRKLRRTTYTRLSVQMVSGVCRLAAAMELCAAPARHVGGVGHARRMPAGDGKRDAQAAGARLECG